MQVTDSDMIYTYPSIGVTTLNNSKFHHINIVAEISDSLPWSEWHSQPEVFKLVTLLNQTYSLIFIMREFEALNRWWYKYWLHVIIWIISRIQLLCVATLDGALLLITKRHITISHYVTEIGIFQKKYHNCWGHRTLHRGASEVMLLIIWDNRTLSSTLMTSSNQDIFRITGSLWGESTGHQWIPLTQASDSELWCFLLSAPEQMVEQTIETPLIWDAIALIVTSL